MYIAVHLTMYYLFTDRTVSNGLTAMNGVNNSGNRFLNGKTLNSVSSSKYGFNSPKPPSNTMTGMPLTPSSIASNRENGAVTMFKKQQLKKNSSNAKNDENRDANKKTLKKEEKDQLLKKLTPTQIRVTQEKVTER